MPITPKQNNNNNNKSNETMHKTQDLYQSVQKDLTLPQHPSTSLLSAIATTSSNSNEPPRSLAMDSSSLNGGESPDVLLDSLIEHLDQDGTMAQVSQHEQHWDAACVQQHQQQQRVTIQRNQTNLQEDPFSHHDSVSKTATDTSGIFAHEAAAAVAAVADSVPSSHSYPTRQQKQKMAACLTLNMTDRFQSSTQPPIPHAAPSKNLPIQHDPSLCNVALRGKDEDANSNEEETVSAATAVDEASKTQQSSEDEEWQDIQTQVRSRRNATVAAASAAATDSTGAATARKQRKRRRERKKYEPDVREYFEFTDADVLCHRGGFANKHPGNIRYHEYKARLQPAYEATPKSKKRLVTQQLVDAVHAWGGRFLEQEEHSERWFEIHEKKALTKASQALRENYTPDERAAKRLRYRQRKEQQEQESKETVDTEDDQEEEETEEV